MLCKNSWIDLSWDGKSNRVDKENLQVVFNRRAKTLLSFDQACDQTAHEIYDSHKNLYLAFSGGSDSEHVATCLLRNKIPFTPLIVNYNKVKSNDQRYEQWYAYHWCKTHQIQPRVIDFGDHISSENEKQAYMAIRPRLFRGGAFASCMRDIMKELGGQLITGSQLEYYPDLEQMTYLQNQLGDYHGFVMEESDLYIETVQPNQHPWAFYYWSPEIMASFVNSWNPDMTMQENKSAIYQTSPRPKFFQAQDLVTSLQNQVREILIKSKWGTRDCALLGTKDQLLSQLLE
jgi:hypothetical protein